MTEVAINVGVLIPFIHEWVGATNFLVANLPSLGQVPKYKGALAEGWMDLLSDFYNQNLEVVLDWVEDNYPVTIYRVDVYGLFEDILSIPEDYGITNISEPACPDCETGECDLTCDVVWNPDEYLFWDELHPSGRGHELIAERALQALGIY
jgi:outer membrane lipase/esterase